MSNYQDQDNLDKWTSQWAKALETDDFKSVPKPKQEETPTTYFGLQTKEVGDDLKDVDVQYWNEIYESISHYGRQGDPNLFENTKEEVLSKTPVAPHPPIAMSTVGKDQDIENVDATYDVSHLERLETLKVKLHNLIDKLNGVESRGQAGGKFESQIQALEKQIDELSNNISGIPL